MRQPNRPASSLAAIDQRKVGIAGTIFRDLVASDHETTRPQIVDRQVIPRVVGVGDCPRRGEVERSNIEGSDLDRQLLILVAEAIGNQHGGRRDTGKLSGIVADKDLYGVSVPGAARDHGKTILVSTRSDEALWGAAH